MITHNSMFDFAVLITTPIIGKIMQYFNKRSFIMFGYAIALITSTYFGTLEFEDDE